MAVTAIDMFAGARGWEALSRDLVSAMGIENNASAVQTSRAAGFPVIEGDVRAYKPGQFIGYEGLIASPPCQTFSLAGRGIGRQALDNVLAAVDEICAGSWPDRLLADLDERTALVVLPLWWALHLTPEWIAWEQVPSVLPVWDACAEVLREEGYYTATGVLFAEQYGVPQTRKRAFIIARREHPVRLPKPTHSRYHVRSPKLLDEGKLPWVSMAQALGYPDAFKWAIRAGTNTKATVREQDEPAPTLFFGERVNGMTIAERQIDIAEAAVLQTFPADYPFQGNKGARFRQVGNAVPPLLARKVLECVI